MLVRHHKPNKGWSFKVLGGVIVLSKAGVGVGVKKLSVSLLAMLVSCC